MKDRRIVRSNAPASPTVDSNALATAAASGDSRAMDQLLRRHYDDVARICRRVCPRDSVAEDATQMALIAIARGIRHFDGRSAFTTWMYRVATNAALDEIRRVERHRHQSLDVDVEVAGPASGSSRGHGMRVDPPAAASGPDVVVVAQDDVDAMMSALSPDHRAVLVLRDGLGCDYAEIGRVLNISVGTVKSRLARARQAALEAMGPSQSSGADGTNTDESTSNRQP